MRVSQAIQAGQFKRGTSTLVGAAGSPAVLCVGVPGGTFSDSGQSQAPHSRSLYYLPDDVFIRVFIQRA